MQYSSFFDAQLLPNGKYDRTYNASDMANVYSSFLGNGIGYNNSIDTALQVNAADNLNIIVNSGDAFIAGYHYINDSQLNININQANSTYPRITSIILELNLGNREIIVKTLDGEASSNPVTPTLTQTSGIYQLQLATIYINAAATSISQSSITDTRENKSVCGYLELIVYEKNLDIIKTEISNIQNNIVTENSSPTLDAPMISGALTITEENGLLVFQNKENKDAFALEIEGNKFQLVDQLCSQPILSYTPDEANTNTIDVYANLNISGNVTNSGSTTNSGVVTNNSNVLCNENLTITEENGLLVFQNKENKDAFALEIEGNKFQLVDQLCSQSILSYTPDEANANTIDVYANLNISGNVTNSGSTINSGVVTNNSNVLCNENLTITEENGLLIFQNKENKNAFALEIEGNQFQLVDQLCDQSILSYTPNEASTSAINIPTNVNIENGAELQINNTNIWQGGNQNLNGYFAVQVSGYTGTLINYTIQYWQMNMGSIINSSTPATGGIGVISVTLTGNGNFSWAGSTGITCSTLSFLTGMNATTLGENSNFKISVNGELNSIFLDNINIVANSNSTPTTYTATALIYG